MTNVPPPIHPEQGFLLRLRTWRDAFPWLAITDCLRPATSIISLALIGATMGLSVVASEWCSETFPDQRRAQAGYLPLLDDLPAAAKMALAIVAGPLLDLLRSPNGLGNRLWLIVHQWILLLIWAVPAGFIIRQSGLAMAGRSVMGTRDCLWMMARRLAAFLAVPLIPLSLLALVIAYFALAALAGTVPGVGGGLELVLTLIGIPLAIIAGLIGFAGFFAAPLAWAAIALERDGSSFDGLSRGYEYVLRRPLQALLYGAIAVAVSVVVGTLVHGVAHVAEVVVGTARIASGWSPGDADEAMAVVLEAIPIIAMLTVGWSLVAWTYLLLRRSANHQEVEDVWEHARPLPEPLPELEL